ncbi:MAG: hypothetical protein ABR886_00575 [Dehalococcoidales bacterium]|jgi:hypothetical protein
MSDQKKKILEMLAQNKISADEAYRLLSAMDKDEGKSDNTGRDNAVHEDPAPRGPEDKSKRKYLRVTITPDPNWQPGDDDQELDPHDDRDHHHSHDDWNHHHGRPDKVNVRIPMSLIRAGIKMKSLVPPEAKDKINNAFRERGLSFDFDSIKNEDIEGLIDALGDMEIDIEGRHGENIKVHVE